MFANSERVVVERKYKPFKGKPDYKHTQRDKGFSITRYVFEAFKDDLRIKSFEYTGKKIDDVVVRNFRKTSALKLYWRIEANATTGSINAPLYDGLLHTYHDNGLELGFVVPILKPF